MAAALHEGDDYLAAAKQDHQRLKQVFSDTRGLSATSIKARQAALNAYERGIAPGVPAYVEARARAYARTFSEPELAQLVTFVESPIGQTWAKARLKIGEGTNFDAVHDAQRTASRAIFCKEFDCPTLDAATTSADKPPALGSRNLPEDAGP